MMYVLEEYERRGSRATQTRKGQGDCICKQPGPSGGGWKTVKGGKGGKLNAEPKANSKTFGGECFNCHGIGHRARNCPSPKQDKPGGTSGTGSKRSQPIHLKSLMGSGLRSLMKTLEITRGVKGEPPCSPKASDHNCCLATVHPSQ
jgi:hypothetical protein